MPQTLPHSPAEIVRQLLIDLGLGVTPAVPAAPWMAYVAVEPDIPDNCLTVYDTQGTDDGRQMAGGKLVSHPGFQVRVRGKDHQTGHVRADAIRTAFAESVSQEQVRVGSQNYYVHAITRIGQVLYLGFEPNSKRSVFTVNATAALRTL